jgi:hypothetical protein
MQIDKTYVILTKWSLLFYLELDGFDEVFSRLHWIYTTIEHAERKRDIDLAN